MVNGAQFSAFLGLNTPLSGAVFADNADLWLQLKIGSEPALPRRPLHAVADSAETPTLAAVALSGSYADLVETPTLAAVALSGSCADLSDKPALAVVALSGAFSDLSGGPDLTGYAKPTEANTWTAPQTLGVDLDFANNAARRFRLEASATEPSPCTGVSWAALETRP